jgi:hypothetical protein
MTEKGSDELAREADPDFEANVQKQLAEEGSDRVADQGDPDEGGESHLSEDE